MGGLVVATVSFTAIVVVLVAVAVAITVLPVFVSLQMADTRRFSSARWLAFSAVTIVAGIGYSYELHKHTSVPLAVSALPLALTWAGPGLLWLLEAGQTKIGGRPGRHE